MAQHEQVFRISRPLIRVAPGRVCGFAVLILLLAGCGRQGEPGGEWTSPTSLEQPRDPFVPARVPTGPGHTRNLFLPVAAAQSPPQADDGSGAKTAGESTPGDGESQPDDTQTESPRTAAEPKAGEVEDKTLRDFTKRRCLDSGCHAGLNRTARVHGPVAVGACHLCHEAEGQPDKHRFKSTRRKEELCSLCHRPADPLAVIHEPYAKYACTDCHNPHGGKSTKFLRGGTADKTCRICHERRETVVAHKPVAEGDCLACHASHQSNFKHLLILDEKRLCLGCHVDQATELEEANYVHDPAAEECTKCHDAHGSDHVGLLKEASQQLCLGCHEDTARGAATAKSGHGFFSGAGGAAARCSDCHRPHASNFPKLLVGSRGKICLTCHSRELKLPSGRTIPSIRQEIASARFVHEPVAKRECGACHLAHFSSYATLLKSSYPAGFYAEFSPVKYELCFSCHDRRLVLEERTNRTQFRDGDRNLHFLHVNRKKGRTCGVCHAAHASQQPAQIRESVSFGPSSWKLPIHFQKNRSGGTCSTGCHQTYSYDNTNPPPAPKETSPGNDRAPNPTSQ